MKKGRLRFLSYKEIDRSKWALLMDKAVNADFFAEDHVLDILAENSWGAFVYDDYTAVFPVGLRKKYGFKYLYQPTFIPYARFYSESVGVAKDIAVDEGYLSSFTYVDLFVERKDVLRHVKSKITERTYQQCDLSNELNFNTNTKRNIAKAKESGLKVVASNNVSAHVEMFREINGSRIATLHAKDYIVMERLLSSLTERGIAKIYVALNNKEEIIATASFVFYKGTIYYFKGAANDEGRKLGAMQLLLSEIMEQNRSTFSKLNFLGSNVLGVSQFNKGLGGKDCLYYAVKINKLPFPLNLIKQIV